MYANKTNKIIGISCNYIDSNGYYRRATNTFFVYLTRVDAFIVLVTVS